MASKNDEKWLANFEAVKAYVAEIGRFPYKHSIGYNWCRYQRKRIKAGTMPEEQKRLFESWRLQGATHTLEDVKRR